MVLACRVLLCRLLLFVVWLSICVVFSCLLMDVCCSLCVARCLLFLMCLICVVRLLLFNACFAVLYCRYVFWCLVFYARCLWFVVWCCLLFVVIFVLVSFSVCCVYVCLCGVCRSLIVACWLMVVVVC